MQRSDQGPVAVLSRIAGSAAFAYSSLLLIQARVMWGIWDRRDLSSGDSVFHFESSAGWADHFEVNYLYSPLYNVLLGTLIWAVEDVYAVMIAQRAIIAVAVTLGVLLVLRHLLTPVIAWLLAVWWALLPVNYDTATELHLFALIPVLIATWIAASHRSRASRSLVFGVLLASAVVIRSELVIAAAAWAAIWAVYELREARRAGARPPLRPLAVAFSLPILVSAALGGLAVLSDDQGIDVPSELAFKDSFAFCQHYALGWQQRHGDLSQSGWVRCNEYAERDFDERQPSMLEALTANPGAVARHFTWNASLAPYGLQLGLLGRTSGPEDRSPDYVQAETGSGLALAGSVALLALLAAGGVLLWRDRAFWLREWLRERAWGWAVLACTALSSLYVLLVIRPRPAYLFALTLALLAVIGMCAMAVVRRRPELARLRAVIPLLAVIAVIALPSHYGEGYTTPQLETGRPLKSAVERLDPFSDRLAGAETSLMSRYPSDVCRYVEPLDPCTGVMPAVLAERPPGQPAAEWLDEEEVDLIYLNEQDFAAGFPRQEVRLLKAAGWRTLASSGSEPVEWVLLEAPAGAVRG
jgi:hypothetical protein